MSTSLTTPLVSIGIPVYNGARFIRRALDHLLAQTYTHLELVICDNASTDDTGPVELGRRVRLHQEVIIETGVGGSLIIGEESNIQPRCQLSAYKGTIHIGTGVMMAPYCALYPYDHGILPEMPIRKQPVRSRGGIVIGDEAWLGVGVIVLDGVRIGAGARKCRSRPRPRSRLTPGG